MRKQIVDIIEKKNSRAREAVSLTLFAQCQEQSTRAPGPIGHTGLVSSSDVVHTKREKSTVAASTPAVTQSTAAGIAAGAGAAAPPQHRAVMSDDSEWRSGE